MHTLHVAGDIRIDKLEVTSVTESFTGTLRVRTADHRRYHGGGHALAVNVKLPADSDFDDDPDDPDDTGLYVYTERDPTLCVGGRRHHLKVQAPTQESPKTGRGMSLTWLAETMGEFSNEVIYRFMHSRK